MHSIQPWAPCCFDCSPVSTTTGNISMICSLRRYSRRAPADGNGFNHGIEWLIQLSVSHVGIVLFLRLRNRFRLENAVRCGGSACFAHSSRPFAGHIVDVSEWTRGQATEAMEMEKRVGTNHGEVVSSVSADSAISYTSIPLDSP